MYARINEVSIGAFYAFLACFKYYIVLIVMVAEHYGLVLF